MNTDQFKVMERRCHPERAVGAKDLCTCSMSAVPSVVKVPDLIRVKLRQSAAKRF